MCQLSSLKTSPGLVSLPGSVQLLHKITNAKTVGAVGINRFKILVIGNIDMWHHPKYYKELRKLRNKEARVNDHSASISDQAISSKNSTEESERSPGPGLKPQAASVKRQAVQDEGDKRQAASGKVQASSRKHQAP